MIKSYTANYLKIYFWQGAAFLLRFLSMFIVAPYITKEPTTYGIYAVCVSVTIFLNYADLGFLRASEKYAAEYYIQGNRSEEMKYIGFGTFVLLIFTLVCTLIFLFLGFHPQILIKGLDSVQKISTASHLLLILSAFTPVIVLQRMVAMVFQIRLDSHKFQRISLCGSAITIASVFYFFEAGKYQIVQYYFFSQIVVFSSTILSLWFLKSEYKYNIKQLFRSIRFDSAVYKKVNGLAYSGLYLMFVWILFYEIDQILIAKFLGAEKVAVYAIAFTFAVLFRSIYGIFFSPFTVRMNHLIGNGDIDGLKRICLQLFLLSAPIVVIPTVAFTLVAKPFIMSWVGVNYVDSVTLARFFALIYTLSFISYTMSMVLIAKVRLNEMYIIGTIEPVIYWIGILVTFSEWGLLSFGLFKLIAILVAEIYYFWLLGDFLEIPLGDLVRKTFYPLLYPLGFLIPALSIANNYLPCEKSKLNLLIVVSTTGVCIVMSMLVQYYSSSDIRLAVQNVINHSKSQVPGAS
jgi:O-antigen/teichoic acid export membrane protein